MIILYMENILRGETLTNLVNPWQLTKLLPSKYHATIGTINMTGIFGVFCHIDNICRRIIQVGLLYSLLLAFNNNHISFIMLIS